MAKKTDRQQALEALTKAKAQPVAVAAVAPAPPATDTPQPVKLRADGTPRRINVKATSVALTTAEFSTLEAIADSVGADRGNVLSWAARYFLREYSAGRISLRMGPRTPGKRRMLELPTGYEIPADAGDA